MNNNVPFNNFNDEMALIEDLPTSTELARKLKEKIRQYGGAKAVWKKLDGRLRDDDIKSIEGQKTSFKKCKITLSAFEKAYKRLGKNDDSAVLDKMSFGIRGNPVLLMNVFEILKLKSYRDLMNYEYKKSDIADEINEINTSIEEINKKINTILTRIESKPYKSIRVLKINIDFHEIIERLYSILINNKDFSLQERYKTKEIQLFELLNTKSIIDKINPENIDKHIKKTRFVSETEKTINIINMIENNYQDEQKRIASLIFLIFDYLPYIFRNKILTTYLRDLENIDLCCDDFLEINISKLSPLLAIYLFLQISLLFIKKIDYRTLQFDDIYENYITNPNQFEEKLRSFIEIIKSINNIIVKLLSIFINYKIEHIPNDKYDTYKNIAIEIIDIFYNIFIKNKKFNDNILKNNQIKNVSTPSDYLKYQESLISGNYNIHSSNFEQLYVILNKLLDITNATMRDLNA